MFVEVGAGSVLTGLVGSILGDRPHLVVATEPTGKKGLAGLLTTLGRLFVGGVSLDFGRLTRDRSCRTVAWSAKGFESTAPVLSPSTWLVNGNRSRPAFGPEPSRFGPGLALPKPEPKPEHTSQSQLEPKPKVAATPTSTRPSPRNRPGTDMCPSRTAHRRLVQRPCRRPAPGPSPTRSSSASRRQ